MGIAATIIGAIGGLFTVIGVITITEVLPASYQLPAQYGWTFWFSLAALMLLATIAFCVADKGNVD